MEIVELSTLIEMTAETVAPLMREKQHEVSIVRAHKLAYVKGDPGRLVQALSNVLINAAKYTPAHGRIRVLAEIRGDTVAIEVSDNGVGIPAEVLPRVFDLSCRASRLLIASREAWG